MALEPDIQTEGQAPPVQPVTPPAPPMPITKILGFTFVAQNETY